MAYGKNPSIIAARVLGRTHGIIYSERISNLPKKDQDIAKTLTVEMIPVESQGGELLPHVGVFKPCKTVNDMVKTGKTDYYPAGEILPRSLHDSTVYFDILSFDEPVPRRRNAANGQLPLLLLPEVPLTFDITRYTCEIPKEIAESNVVADKKFTISFRFAVDQIHVQLSRANDPNGPKFDAVNVEQGS